jgi:hypothetical protein
MKVLKSLMLATAVALPLANIPAMAADNAPLQERYDTLGMGVALGGYDPVAYFAEGGNDPAKGFVQRDYTYQGVTYRFSTDANRELFKKNPEKYTPAYNGWCAWAMSELDAKVDIEPSAFDVHKGKLYVFYDHDDLHTRDLWRKDPDGMIARANANWKHHSK